MPVGSIFASKAEVEPAKAQAAGEPSNRQTHGFYPSNMLIHVETMKNRSGLCRKVVLQKVMAFLGGNMTRQTSSGIGGGPFSDQTTWIDFPLQGGPSHVKGGFINHIDYKPKLS